MRNAPSISALHLNIRYQDNLRMSLSLENYRDQLDTLSVICACVTARGPSPSISPILDANKKNLYKSRSREANE
jgi:hypothetical protein